MRAIELKPFLALALFVARVGAQDAHDAFAPHDLAVLTNFLYRRSNLHMNLYRIPVRYSAAGQVVWRQFHRDRLSAGQDFYVVHPHFARDMRRLPCARCRASLLNTALGRAS